MKPLARKEGLLMQDLGDELILYDRKNHRAHNLNLTAAIVWRNCDGKHSVAELTSLVRRELSDTEEAAVLLALKKLKAAQLLIGDLGPAVSAVSRRDLGRSLRKVGAASFLLPVVTSILAPTPAQAATQMICCQCEGTCLETAHNDCSKLCPGGADGVVMAGKTCHDSGPNRNKCA